MSKLDAGDYRMLEYFHFDKGDVTRWVGWEEKSKLLEKEHPELYNAFIEYESANKTIKLILDAKRMEYPLE